MLSGSKESNDSPRTDGTTNSRASEALRVEGIRRCSTGAANSSSAEFKIAAGLAHALMCDPRSGRGQHCASKVIVARHLEPLVPVEVDAIPQQIYPVKWSAAVHVHFAGNAGSH